MKKNLKNKKMLLLILILLLIVISGFVIYFLLTNETKIYEINRTNYSFKYDSTWKVTKQEENEIKLIHKKSKSELGIQINELDEEKQYKELSEIFDSFLYNIQEQNKGYKLIYRENIQINSMDGYKILFENENGQSAVYFYRQGNKIVTFIYEATYDYFDILLDNINNMISNFNLIEQKFDVITEINLETEEIDFTEQRDVEELLKETKEEEIANNNYLVRYEIPSNFKSTYYSTTYGNYKFQDVEIGKSIYANFRILNCNIYQYLDRDNDLNVYSNYDLNSYNKQKEVLSKYGEQPLSYIYKNNYLTNNEMTENIQIIYELNKNHILTIAISSNGLGIPEKLIKMIKINEFENIAGNIKVNKENGFLLGNLKKFDSNHKTQDITLKLPEKYQEIDKQTNLYEERNYGLNYNEEKQFYEYEVNYAIVGLTIEQKLNSLDQSVYKKYGKYKNFTKLEDIKLKDKEFKISERGYTQLSVATDKKGNRYKYYTKERVLFYELEDNQYLFISIKANDKDINDELIEQLINFDIKIN